MLPPARVDPDQKPPLPAPTALDDAQTVTAWALETAQALKTAQAQVAVVRDVAYGPHRLHRYNVFAPAAGHNLPMLVFWHGGGWTNGYRDWATFMAPLVVGLGMVLAAASYRLAPAHPLPCAAQDRLALLVGLQARVTEWRGAPDRLYLAGHSADGHVVALAALRSAARAEAVHHRLKPTRLTPTRLKPRSAR